MRIGRVAHGAKEWLGRIEGETFTPVLEGAGWSADVATLPAAGDPIPLDECRLLAPVAAPGKILCIGLNYADHARETGQEPPAAPILFVKTANTLIGPGDEIRYAKDDSTQVDYEAELAVVIGRRAKRVEEADALDHVFGYTALNDVSARDAQFADGQWIRGKSFDTFCPVGPWIVTADEIPDPQALHIACRVNGQTVQDSTTGQMIFGVRALISYLSRFITLEPGDIIATGTPFGVGVARTPQIFLLHGDTVEVEVEGIGILANPVVVD